MAWIRVVLQDESGCQIGEGIDIAAKIFPQLGDDCLFVFRFVDLYGDTVFNALQAKFVVDELGILKTEHRRPSGPCCDGEN